MRNGAIHLWLPEMDATGGIQTYCRALVRVLIDSTPETQKLVLIKNDLEVKMEPTTGVRWICFGRWPKTLRTVVFAFSLLFSTLISRPTLIISGHVHFARIAFFLKRFFNIPYWVVIYGIEVWAERACKFGNVLNMADRIISISEFTKEEVIKQNKIDPSKFWILPNTFCQERFRPAPKPKALMRKMNIHDGTRVILTVGRLSSREAYKGYDRILEALPAILQVIPDVRYIILGTGDDESRIRQLIQQLRLEKFVSLPGFVEDDELVKFYSLCDVFAMPSKGEGFGNVYLEAMACGKPVLAGSKDGGAEALQHGRLGALVDPDDVDLISNKLIEILQGTYVHPLIYEPERLRDEVIARYGFTQFQKTFSNYLEEFLNQEK